MHIFGKFRENTRRYDGYNFEESRWQIAHAPFITPLSLSLPHRYLFHSFRVAYLSLSLSRLRVLTFHYL